MLKQFFPILKTSGGVTLKKGTIRSLTIVALLILVIGVPLLVRGARSACNDNVDNDGDGATDYPADAGCANNQDNDETNCGDGAVSGSEVCDGTNLNGQTCVTQGFGGGALSCGATCSSFVTTSCWTNTCSDTDGGTVQGTQGTVSGNYQGAPYSDTDSCLDSITLKEWRCVTVGSGLGGGLTGSSSNYNCNQINGTNYTSCVSGACQ
ncbi:MAG TPA: hypothetical protein VJC07_03135 [Candidatus Nanoarchaeia archaeon]|nr:hypothetical protein [Candidatus Nanoarchaeia archaeon]